MGIRNGKEHPTFLVLQPHGYCFRINLPADLKKFVALQEIRNSLRSKDYLYARTIVLFLDLHLISFDKKSRGVCP